MKVSGTLKVSPNYPTFHDPEVTSSHMIPDKTAPVVDAKGKRREIDREREAASPLRGGTVTSKADRAARLTARVARPGLNSRDAATRIP